MEDIFGDLNQEGHQTSIASLEAVEGEGEKPGTTMVKEVIIDGGHKEVRPQADQGALIRQLVADGAGETQLASEEGVPE